MNSAYSTGVGSGGGGGGGFSEPPSYLLEFKKRVFFHAFFMHETFYRAIVQGVVHCLAF